MLDKGPTRGVKKPALSYEALITSAKFEAKFIVKMICLFFILGNNSEKEVAKQYMY